jgi:hypothetical protein
LSIRLAPGRQQTGGGAQRDRILAGFRHHQVGDTAGCVAASPRLAAVVAVVDAHDGIGGGIIGGRRLDGDELIAADARATVADRSDHLRRKRT